MKLSVLLENGAREPKLKSAHGLSLYLETQRHRLLFDFGPDDAFLYNAQEMGIDLKSVDASVLSHAHNDHGGGLPAFLKHNQTAPVYLRKGAFGEYFGDGGARFIGLDPALENDPRLIKTEGVLEIDEELKLFSDVAKEELVSRANQTLLTKQEGKLICDPFLHEQHLAVRSGGKTILLCGCAHRGIVNILTRAAELEIVPDVVFGGMHLCNPATGAAEAEGLIREIARRLSQTKARFYTGHCTGDAAFLILKDVLGDRITRFMGGDRFSF